MRNYKKESKALRALAKGAFILAVAIAVITACMLLIRWSGKSSQQAQQPQQEEAEPLVITTPEPQTKGNIRVFDYDGCCIYAYYGEIKINSDGRNGKEIDIECAGYLEGYQQHGEKEIEEERGVTENE